MKNLLILCTLLFTPLLAFSDDFKIATVDMGKILNESPVAKTKHEELSKLSKVAKDKVDKKRNELKTLEAKLKAQNVKEDSKEADQFRSQARDLARLMKDSEEDLKRKYMVFTKSLTDDATKVIAAYSAKNGISLVLERSENMRGPVLYGEKGFDITDDILSEMSKAH